MATLDPILLSTTPIPSHAFVAVAAGALALAQFALPKGTLVHRAIGWVFVVGMGYVALSALFISTVKMWGYFSPIHLTVPVVLWTLVTSIRSARAGRIAEHRRSMIWLWVLAIFVTGGFTLMPGRVMHAVLFGPP